MCSGWLGLLNKLSRFIIWFGNLRKIEKKIGYANEQSFLFGSHNSSAKTLFVVRYLFVSDFDSNPWNKLTENMEDSIDFYCVPRENNQDLTKVPYYYQSLNYIVCKSILPITLHNKTHLFRQI